jgi:hypothetical protein
MSQTTLGRWYGCECKDEGWQHTARDWANDKETADVLRKHGAKTAKELNAEGK